MLSHNNFLLGFLKRQSHKEITFSKVTETYRMNDYFKKVLNFQKL